MALIGNVPEFNSEKDDWLVYSERLEQFFEVNDIPEEKQSAFLISSIGANSYKTLRDLCHPDLPKDKSVDELCDLMKKHFMPKIAVFRERNKFYHARQMPRESVANWFARIKKFSVECRFGKNLDEILLDRFISGLNLSPILDRLCEEDETLTLEQAVNLAASKESSLKSMSSDAGSSNSQQHHHQKPKPQNNNQKSDKNNPKQQNNNQKSDNSNKQVHKDTPRKHYRPRNDGKTQNVSHITVNVPK